MLYAVNLLGFFLVTDMVFEPNLDEKAQEKNYDDPLSGAGTSETQPGFDPPPKPSTIEKLKNYFNAARRKILNKLQKEIGLSECINVNETVEIKNHSPTSEKLKQASQSDISESARSSLPFYDDQGHSDAEKPCSNMLSADSGIHHFSEHKNNLPSTTISPNLSIYSSTTASNSGTVVHSNDVQNVHEICTPHLLQLVPASDLQDTGETGGGGDRHSGGDCNQRQTSVSTSTLSKTQSSVNGSGNCGAGGGGDDGGEDGDKDPTKRRRPLDKDEAVQQQQKNEDEKAGCKREGESEENVARESRACVSQAAHSSSIRQCPSQVC